MRIKQIYVSPGLKHFEDRIKTKYGLGDYRSRYEPAFFYGFFTAAPIAVAAHKGFGVILWAGSDILRLVSYVKKGKRIPNQHAVEKVLKMKNIFHICRSEQIKEDMEFCGLPYKYVRVSPTLPELFKPCSLGPSVYCYGYKRKPEKYGGDKIRALRKDFSDVTFLTKDVINESVPYEDISYLYEQCFINLRLTAHDGLPNSVLEMGLMGRRSVYNGDIPGSIPWNNYQDIVDAIESERKKIGQHGDVKISSKIREMLDIPDDWLDTEFYE